MFYLLCVLLWTSNFVLCDDKNIEIQELKGIVARMEETMELQGNAISKYHQQMEEANEKINHLTEQVSAFQKGNRGKRQAERVAFTAYLDHGQAVHSGNVLKFNQILYNVGNAYNVHTGIFTVPITGTYLFSFQVEDWRTKELTFYLMVDGQNMVDAIIGNTGSTHSGNTAILGLTVGNAVWIESADGYAFGENNFRGTTFCGAFLY